MMDNVVFATDSMRSSVASLKKKLSNIKISVEVLDAELEKIDTKFDKLLTQTEIYKAKLGREMGREVRKLEMEIAKLRKQVSESNPILGPQVSLGEIKIASTIAVFECILRHICNGADDIRLMSYAFLFPAVVERVVSSEDPAYLLEELPPSAATVIQRGREYVTYIRSQCDTHVTDPEAWEVFLDEVCNWWKNDALPLLYGCRDEQWDTDIPLTLAEMMIWRDDLSERPIHFSAVFDAYEIYRNNRDEVYGACGARDLDLKMFTYQTESPDQG